MTLNAFVFPKWQTLKTWLSHRVKSPVSEETSRSKMLNVPKVSCNLHHSIFIKFIGHWQGNCVWKSLSCSHVKSWDHLLTNWLPMKSILFFIETIWRYQFRCNYLTNKKKFSLFFVGFLKFISNFEPFEKKDDRHRVCISEIIGFENVVR